MPKLSEWIVRYGLAAAVIALMAGTAGRASAEVIYATGFERPTFLPGGLSGQDGWGVAGLPENTFVEDSFARTGRQAVQINAANNPDNSGPIRFLGNAGPIVDVSADQYFSTAGTPTFRQAFEILNSNGGLIADAEQISDGTVLLFSGTRSESIAGPTRDAWHNWEFQVDFTSQTFTFLIDGTALATGRPLASSSAGLRAVAFLDAGTGTDHRYLDNFSASDNAIVPEPPSLVSAGLGLPMLLGYARRPRRLVVARRGASSTRGPTVRTASPGV